MAGLDRLFAARAAATDNQVTSPVVNDTPSDDLLTAGFHEAQRPLALIQGYLAILQHESLGALSAQQQRALYRIGEKVAEACDQLERIHAIARLHRDSIDVVHLVLEDEVRLAVERGTAKADLLTGSLRFTPNQTTRVRADRVLLRQILDNLIDNALTYTDFPPAVWIEVDATPRPSVRIHDSGQGFSPAAATRAFEAGYRVHPQDVRRPGSGLGLNLSRRAASRMGGSLELEETHEGTGSTFLLQLSPVTGSVSAATVCT